MKEITIYVKGIQKTGTLPDNCRHPRIYTPLKCRALNHHHPECDCHWCVFHSMFNQAGTND